MFSTTPTLIDADAERAFLREEGALLEAERKKKLADFSALISAEYRRLMDSMLRTSEPLFLVPKPMNLFRIDPVSHPPPNETKCGRCRGIGFTMMGRCAICGGSGRV